MGAEEFGVPTEIIRAMSQRVLPCTGCGGCHKTKKCTLRDDVDWILERTCLDDCALIIAVPCYHVRANAYFTCINERMNHIFDRDMSIIKKTRVGAIIGVGGSGYDGWASLNLPMVDIFMQHTRKVVDRIQINFCALKEWNRWDRTETTQAASKHRITDTDYDKIEGLWGAQADRVDFFKKAQARARQLGRNVAKAMAVPIEQVDYAGERSGVECPVCHGNILHVHEQLPHVQCPVCAVRGEVVLESGAMRVKWNEADAKVPRFSYDGLVHHLDWINSHYGAQPNYFTAVKELIKPHRSYGKIIAPEKALKELAIAAK